MKPWLGLALPALVALAAAPEKLPLSDAALESKAREAMASSDPSTQRTAVKALRTHSFKHSKVPEREFCLYAQGMLQDRLGETLKGAETLRKLERGWPKSPYLPEAQVVMAHEAVERKRVKEAEARLGKALSSNELPEESRQRAQELLVWALVEQGRAEEGLSTARELLPRASTLATDRALVAMVEVFALAQDRPSAEKARAECHTKHPESPLRPRLELAWARLLGGLGDAVASAEALRKLLDDFPKSREADEARLALASLLTEGRLPPKKAAGMPSPEELLRQISSAGAGSDTGRRALLVQTRIHLGAGHWQEAIDTALKVTSNHPNPVEAATAERLRMDALKGWTQACLEKDQPMPLLGYLDAKGIQGLSPEQRRGLAQSLARRGLPEASQAILAAAPEREREALRRSILEATPQGLPGTPTLALSGQTPSNPTARLRRAQALLDQGNWSEASKFLEGAKPGPERVAALVLYLRRPSGPKEAAGSRLAEAEAKLARAPERGSDREPLAILVADLRVQAGNWKGALALYPQEPSPEQRAWVGLMRATCLARLGQKQGARQALSRVEQEKGFESERRLLANQLGP